MEQKSEGDPRSRKWFHISTKGIDRSLFKAPEDYRQMLNIIAASAAKFNIVILAYCLMTNHIHLEGRTAADTDLLKFINTIKQNYSRYFKIKYGVDRIFGRVEVSINELKTARDLRNCLAYILRNPVEARICQNADQYLWSSYSCYFAKEDATQDSVQIKDFSKVYLKKLLKTHCDVTSQNYKLTKDGYILPGSFVDTKFVEELFGNSRDELAKSIAINPYLALEFELANPVKLGLPHYELVRVASELAEQKFGQKLSTLPPNARAGLAVKLHSDYSAGPYEICQILSLSRKSVNQILGLESEKPEGAGV